MTNFNPINFINKLLTSQTPTKNENVENRPPSQNMPGDNLIFKRMAQQVNQAQQAAQANLPQKAAAAMDANEKSALLKDFLKLPNELKEFLNQNTQNSAMMMLNVKMTPEMLAKKLEVSQLMQLLMQNSQEGSQKLMQLIAQTARNGGDVQQLKQLMNLLNNNIAASNVSNEANQVLKNLILLYLPFVPLKEHREDELDFELNFFEEENKEGKGEEGGPSQSVNVMIKTNNYGNVRAYLELKSPNDLTTLLYCREDFPKGMLEKLLAQEAKEINLKSNFVSETVKAQTQSPSEDSGSVKISAQSSVNSYLLLITYSLIRLVVSIDKGLSADAAVIH